MYIHRNTYTHITHSILPNIGDGTELDVRDLFPMCAVFSVFYTEMLRTIERDQTHRKTAAIGPNTQKENTKNKFLNGRDRFSITTLEKPAHAEKPRAKDKRKRK